MVESRSRDLILPSDWCRSSSSQELAQVLASNRNKKKVRAAARLLEDNVTYTITVTATRWAVIGGHEVT